MHEIDPSAHIIHAIEKLAERLDNIALATIPRLLTIQEAATALGVSRDTVRRMCDRREIGYVQAEHGAAKRIPLADVQAWIDRHTVCSEPHLKGAQSHGICEGRK